MTRNNDAHNIVLESLTEALLQMMETKQLSDINISALCDRAGVSRVSFYRNYDSKEDILVRHLIKCTDEWWAEFEKSAGPDYYIEFWPELLDQYRRNERLIRLIYSNNVTRVIKDHIFFCCCSVATEDERDAYARAALAGAIYGLVDEWIKRGMGDFPKGIDLHSLIAGVMPDSRFAEDDR